MAQSEANTELRCPKCKKPTQLMERIWVAKTSSYIRIFKCRCGEMVWDE
jgi:hypothetical protein